MKDVLEAHLYAGPESVRVDTVVERPVVYGIPPHNIGEASWAKSKSSSHARQHVWWWDPCVPVECILSRGCEDTPTTPAAPRLINGGRSFCLITRVMRESAATPELARRAVLGGWLAGKGQGRMRLPSQPSCTFASSQHNPCTARLLPDLLFGSLSCAYHLYHRITELLLLHTAIPEESQSRLRHSNGAWRSHFFQFPNPCRRSPSRACRELLRESPQD